MKNLFSLEGKIALVTGGFGQIGSAFVNGLIEAGAQVIVVDIMKSEPKDFGWSDSRVICFKCDITDRNKVSSLADEIYKKFNRYPSILINNAAIDSPPDAPASENGPFETYSETSLDKIYKVNVKGTVNCCQVFGGKMADSGGGSIINVSSIYGVVSPNQDVYEFKRKNGEMWYKPVGYAVSKSAIMNLTRYLAVYWAKKRVRVNTLVPAGIWNNQSQEFLDAYHQRIPIGRMADVSELVGPMILLASDASSYMTGSALFVDGGYTAW